MEMSSYKWIDLKVTTEGQKLTKSKKKKKRVKNTTERLGRPLLTD